MYRRKYPIPPDPVIEAYKRDVDRTLVREALRAGVEGRMRGLVEMRRWVEECRRARERRTSKPS